MHHFFILRSADMMFGTAPPSSTCDDVCRKSELDAARTSSSLKCIATLHLTALPVAMLYTVKHRSADGIEFLRPEVKQTMYKNGKELDVLHLSTRAYLLTRKRSRSRTTFVFQVTDMIPPHLLHPMQYAESTTKSWTRPTYIRTRPYL